MSNGLEPDFYIGMIERVSFDLILTKEDCVKIYKRQFYDELSKLRDFHEMTPLETGSVNCVSKGLGKAQTVHQFCKIEFCLAFSH